jgi:hypothetical protein
MTLTDREVLNMIDTLLDNNGVPSRDHGRYVREHRKSVAFLKALTPLVDRYLAIIDPPRLCQIEHDHWEGKMICGNPLPCRTHGGD